MQIKESGIWMLAESVYGLGWNPRCILQFSILLWLWTRNDESHVNLSLSAFNSMIYFRDISILFLLKCWNSAGKKIRWVTLQKGQLRPAALEDILGRKPDSHGRFFQVPLQCCKTGEDSLLRMSTVWTKKYILIPFNNLLQALRKRDPNVIKQFWYRTNCYWTRFGVIIKAVKHSTLQLTRLGFGSNYFVNFPWLRFRNIFKSFEG
jgi:hypothetical protein